MKKFIKRKEYKTDRVIKSFAIRFATLILAVILFEFTYIMTIERFYHSRLDEFIQALINGIASGLAYVILSWYIVLKPLLLALKRDHALLARNQQELESELKRHELNKKLGKAFAMAESESSILGVFKRAVNKYLPEVPVELLLADSSNAHMRLAASTLETAPEASANPDNQIEDANGNKVDKELNTMICKVATPIDCPATRYADTQINEDSLDLDACPVLVERGRPSLSALCEPVNIAGKTIGVIHSDFDKEKIDIPNAVSIISLISYHLGSRLGLVRALDTAQQAAMTDPLTGVMNRRSLEDHCDSLLMGGRLFSLVMADIDHFKKLNDTYSHAVGDRSLKVFANILNKSCRGDDVVARLGGEEFCMVFLDIGAEKAVELLERIRKKLPDALTKAGLPEFTASFGVSDTNLASTLEDLLKISDHAMYKAKQAGRDRIVVGSPNLENM